MHTRGVKGPGLSDKTGRLCAIATVSEEEDLMLLRSEGGVIRVAVADIPVYSRGAGGVIVMRVPENEQVVNFTVVEKEEDELEPVTDIPAEERLPEEQEEQQESLPAEPSAE